MTDEDFEDALVTVKYFQREKADVTRWIGWEEFKPILKERRPDLYYIIERYLEVMRAIDAAFNNL